MSKTLRTAALVVGALALASTGVGAAIGAGLIAESATFAVAAGSFAAAAGTLSAVATGLALTANLTAKKPSASVGGSQTRFKADPLAGIPYAIGRTMVGGNIVYHKAHGTDNAFNTYVTVLSGGGPIEAYESFLVEKVPITFSSGAAVGGYAGWMWKADQLGAQPESTALAVPAGAGSTPPGWDSDNKLSGMAAAIWTLKFDKKGKIFAAGTPQPGWVGQWVKTYDPRLDDTYPGGEGDCRALDESTYVWSENPYLHSLTWLLGRWQNGSRVLGVGAPVSMIDVAAFVEGANVADANEWTVGGQVYSTDSKWNVLKMMLQAGGGEPLRLGARISCLINTPRVSLGTVTRADILGEASVAATQPRRYRFNAVVPVYRSEAHDWEVVSAAPVMVDDYVTEDGERRTKEIIYPLVQDVNQVAELALYDIVNAREFGPVEMQLKPKWLGYKPGDCITVDEPELGLEGQDILILNRTLEPSGLVTFVARSETSAKHAFALGQTGTPPPTPGVTGDDLNTVLAPAADAWELIGTEFSDNGSTIPALVVTGACENINADAVLFELQPDGSSEWTKLGMEPPTVTRKEITGVTPGTGYFVGVSYRVRGVLGARRVLGPESVGELVSGDARREIGNTERRTIRSLDQLGQLAMRLNLEASRTREVFRDAGFIIDPDAGTVKIFAVEKQGERINTAEIGLSAAQAAINLRATYTYVDEQIMAAVLDPTTVADLAPILARLTVAESDISALEGAITDFVSTATVTALDTRVSNTETALLALGDVASIVQSATVNRYAREQDALTDLRNALSIDKARRATLLASASARTELYAKINSDVGAEAAARTALAVEVAGKASAGALSSLSASVSEIDGEVSALAAALIEVDSDLGDASATAALALSTANGEEAVAALTADVDGFIVSMTLNGSDSSIKFRANYFEVRDLAGNLLLGLVGSDYVFSGETAGTVGGVPAAEIAAMATTGAIRVEPITAAGASPEILFVLPAGASRDAVAELNTTSLSGSSTVTLALQVSVDGGSWSDLDTDDGSGGVGEPVTGLFAAGTYTNSTGSQQVVRFRANVSSTPSVTITVASTSYVSA